MAFGLETRNSAFMPPRVANMLWIALIAALSVGGSLAFACAAPLAAISALAATRMDSRTGLALTVTAWLSNQIVGYGILDYPVTANSFAWGGAIGIAAVLAFLSARGIDTKRPPQIFGLALAFLIAFAAYELALYAAGFVLGGSDAAFSFAIVARIFAINAVAFAGLLLVHRLLVRYLPAREMLRA